MLLRAALAFKEQTMKTKHGLLFGFAVLLMAAIFSLTGCPTDNAEGWDVHISDTDKGSAITDAVIPASPGFKILYAIITGSLTGDLAPSDTTYQWTKDGSPVGSSATYLSVTEAGSYTVEVTAKDNGAKTSAAVSVTTE
jgi:hypothetical protein